MPQQNLHVYRLEELKKATYEFSDDNLIGKGGFGVVYKGEVDGRIVAIKKINENSVPRVDVALAHEVSVLQFLEHDNVVKLLGFCSESGHYLSVYQYMQNGDLKMYLEDQSKREKLTWEKRFNIINGIAEGLVYLHGLKDAIIHRDLKPANVLLNENHTAKIADFNLSETLAENETHITAEILCGTVGYIAPESHLALRYSPKSDVHNFGLLVLEIIAGCNIMDYSISKSNDRPAVLQFDVWHQWKNKKPLLGFIDQILRNDCMQDQIDHIERCILIGLLCVQYNSNKRPNMKDVLQMLNNCNISLLPPDTPSYIIGGEARLRRALVDFL
ncbi:cysteine-rich RECEPTOR-like kinase [Rhynchospora pubera]|uniref:non-specific serine/threonine protein kinase n=1 Tax=Rhynchospora pubera TaxID=906938 RepID=A0AAV8C0D6_9POAL|nr:cysteine-rich RECEPTOR-like kinase [Rhynchospora pubera]